MQNTSNKRNKAIKETKQYKEDLWCEEKHVRI